MHVPRASSRLVSGLSQCGVLALVGRGPRGRRESAQHAGATTRQRSGVGLDASRKTVDRQSDMFTLRQDTDPTLDPIQAAYVCMLVARPDPPDLRSPSPV